MKKLILVCLFSYVSCTLMGQELKSIEKNNWGNINTSGFFSVLGKAGTESPIENDRWWWGINSTYINNTATGQYYNAQLAFDYYQTPVQIYTRITDKYGKGEWAKILHSKGNHAIDGKLTAKEIEIKLVTGADFVFEPDYNLKPLAEVEAFVKENKHLPEIQSEKDMKENGLNINDMQIKLLQKVEELTLYVIEQDKQIQELKLQLNKQADKK